MTAESDLAQRSLEGAHIGEGVRFFLGGGGGGYNLPVIQVTAYVTQYTDSIKNSKCSMSWSQTCAWRHVLTEAIMCSVSIGSGRVGKRSPLTTPEDLKLYTRDSVHKPGLNESVGWASFVLCKLRFEGDNCNIIVAYVISIVLIPPFTHSLAISKKNSAEMFHSVFFELVS